MTLDVVRMLSTSKQANCLFYTFIFDPVQWVAISAELKPPMQEMGSLIPGCVKLLDYQIYTYCFLAWRLALIG